MKKILIIHRSFIRIKLEIILFTSVFEFNRKYNKIPVYTIAAYIGRKRNVIETSMYSKSITGTIGVSGLIKLKECIDFFVEDFF